MKKLLISLFVISSFFYGNYIYAEDKQELYFIDAHSQIDHQVSGINLVLERMADNNVKTILLASVHPETTNFWMRTSYKRKKKLDGYIGMELYTS